MTVAGVLFGLTVTGAGGLVAAGLAAEASRATLTDADRAITSGRFVQAKAGRVHLRSWGAAGGPVALCVHGLSTPSPVWQPLAERLAAAGWRVLAPDLYGRGLSDRPTRVHDERLYLNQITEVMAAEDVDRLSLLIGFSMGGSLAAAFAARHPETVARLALLAPAGFAHGLRGLYVAAHVPILGDAAWSLFAGGMLRRGAAAEGTGHALPELEAMLNLETRRRGYLPALLSAMRYTVPVPREAAHQRLAAYGIPVIAVWGARDDVIPIAAKDALARANPDARQVVLEEAGHGLPYTHPDRVAQIIQDWAASA